MFISVVINSRYLKLLSLGLLFATSATLIFSACVVSEKPVEQEPEPVMMDEMDEEEPNLSGVIPIDAAHLTADLAFTVESYWSAQGYLSTILGAIREQVAGQIEDTIRPFGEDVDLSTQDVILVDLLIDHPDNATEPLRYIANGENSQFVLMGNDGSLHTTKTWVEPPTSTIELGDPIDFLPFSEFFLMAGTQFLLQAASVTADLIIHGQNADGTYFEEPLMLDPGNRLRIWLAYIVPQGGEPFSLQFGNTVIPLSSE